jgi:hypothetical protein
MNFNLGYFLPFERCALQLLREYFLIIFYRLKFPELEVHLCNLEIAYILLLAQTVLDQGKCEYCYSLYTATIFIQLKNTLHKKHFSSLIFQYLF